MKASRIEIPSHGSLITMSSQMFVSREGLPAHIDGSSNILGQYVDRVSSFYGAVNVYVLLFLHLIVYIYKNIFIRNYT